MVRFKRALVLLSGGLDSATCLHIARKDSKEVIALTFRYGQRHEKEIVAARAIARNAGIAEHRIMDLDLGHVASALLDPGANMREDGVGTDKVPTTYVPARNLVLLSHAVSLAEAIGADAIYIGVTWPDSSGYPDCTQEFIDVFRKAAATGTRCGREGRPIEILTPLIDLGKVDIIRIGTELAVPYELTWSCYKGGDGPCGKCDACRLRAKGFDEAGSKDPLLR